MNTKDLHPGLGSGALREALALCVETFEIQDMRDSTAYQIAKKALSLFSPIEPPHEPQLYATEGPVSGVNGTFTVAFLGCTCGWNRDGEAAKTQKWSEHIAPQASSEIREALLGRLIECVAPCLSAPNSGFNEVKLKRMLGDALAPSRQGAAKRVEG